MSCKKIDIVIFNSKVSDNVLRIIIDKPLAVCRYFVTYFLGDSLSVCFYYNHCPDELKAKGNH